jgi:hypothetical protein
LFDQEFQEAVVIEDRGRIGWILDTGYSMLVENRESSIEFERYTAFNEPSA